MKHHIRNTIFMVALTGCALWLSGCSHILAGGKTADPQVDTASASVSAPAATLQTRAVYYDFDDVLIPVGLRVIQDRSMIVSTPGFTSGILMLKGRVERRSLINFFNNNMLKDNWIMVSQITSPKNAILVFEKPLKSAVISIKNEQIFTYVEMGVAVRINQGRLPQDIDTLSESGLTQ